MGLHRRQFLAVSASAALGAAPQTLLAQDAAAPAPAPATPAPPPAFGFAEVRALAEKLAQAPHDATVVAVPDKLRELTPADYQKIRYRDENELWRNDNTRFRVVFRHIGSFYLRPAKINVVDHGQITPIAYRPDLFEFGAEGLGADLPPDLGFSGFTVHYAEEDPADFPEVASFHGASYFRVLGSSQQYGLSARGLAIDTALPNGEEFPFFREFWLFKPAPGAAELTMLALLDSPAITGAYQFVLRPGVVAVTEINSVLFPRHGIGKLGIAPLTSMFMYGENRGRMFDDFRPELHDSDGLLMNNGRGEWIWRPLVNHATLQVSAFVDSDPRGFGLFQRDLRFSSYEDLDHRYQRRPSMWVEPTSGWGAGHVELIEIPSEHPDNDNVVAFWVADAPAEPGKPIAQAYRLHSQLDQPRRPPLGRAEATRIGPSQSGVGRRFYIDFSGGRLAEIAADAPLQPMVKAYQGGTNAINLRYDRDIEGWRLAFDLDPAEEPLCEIRAFLQLGDELVTEIWTYRWTPA